MVLNKLEKVKCIVEALISFETKGGYDTEFFREYRKDFLSIKVYELFIPEILRRYMTENIILKYLQNKSDTYVGRREFLWKEFQPLLDFVDRREVNSADKILMKDIKTSGGGYIPKNGVKYWKGVRRVLGGCYNIVLGMGTLRNKISDAHGQGINKVNPNQRPATLTIKVAGILATFLLQTRNCKRKY